MSLARRPRQSIGGESRRSGRTIWTGTDSLSVHGSLHRQLSTGLIGAAMSEQLATAAAMSCMKMLLMLFNVCFWVSGGGRAPAVLFMHDESHLRSCADRDWESLMELQQRMSWVLFDSLKCNVPIYIFVVGKVGARQRRAGEVIFSSPTTVVPPKQYNV